MRFVSVPLALTVLIVAPAASRANEVDAAYHAAVDMDLREAARLFSAVYETQPEDRETRFGHALALLNDQPQTASKLDQARALLDGLHADRDAPDDLRAAALFFRARIEHSHAMPPAPEKAESLYRQTMAEFPDSIYAERAFLFHAIARQYRSVSTDEKRADLLALDAEAATRLKTPRVRSSYHLVAGLAWSRVLRDDAHALDHYRAVYAIGLESDHEAANLLVRLAELSRRRGDDAAALQYFREFLKRYPADRRSALAADWVRALEQPRP
jgi:hypothetical protein